MMNIKLLFLTDDFRLFLEEREVEMSEVHSTEVRQTDDEVSLKCVTSIEEKVSLVSFNKGQHEISIQNKAFPIHPFLQILTSLPRTRKHVVFENLLEVAIHNENLILMAKRYSIYNIAESSVNPRTLHLIGESLCSVLDAITEGFIVDEYISRKIVSSAYLDHIERSISIMTGDCHIERERKEAQFISI